MLKEKKLHMSFVDVENAFDRISRKVLKMATRNKTILKVLFGSVMSMYKGAKTKVRVDSEVSEELDVNVEMHQGFVLSPFLFAVGVDVVT